MKHSVIAFALILGVIASAAANGAPETFRGEYRDLRSVEISAAMMDVEISAGDGNTVTVYVENIPRGVSVSDHVRRGGVAIHVQGRSSWLDRDLPRARITVRVPNGINLDVGTGSGSIAIRGVQGHQTLRSASGSISLDQLGGEIAVQSASGRVTVRNVVGTITIGTASGAVTLEDCRGIIAVETASGSITGEGVQLTADAAFRTASGSIRVDLDNSMDDLRYNLSSSSGRLRFENISSNGNYLRGGSGRFLVEARTASGSQEFF